MIYFSEVCGTQRYARSFCAIMVIIMIAMIMYSSHSFRDVCTKDWAKCGQRSLHEKPQQILAGMRKLKQRKIVNVYRTQLCVRPSKNHLPFKKNQRKRLKAESTAVRLHCLLKFVNQQRRWEDSMGLDAGGKIRVCRGKTRDTGLIGD